MKSGKKESGKPDWLVKAQRELVVVKAKIVAEERRRNDMARRRRNCENKAEAERIISSLQGLVEKAARNARDEVVLRGISSDCRTLEELDGAAKLIAEHCRKIRLMLEIRIERVGPLQDERRWLVAKL